PDVKESIGGLRDATVINGLVATWLVDVPHSDLERSRQSLLDVRDALHAAAGRATDRIAPEFWAPIAETLGLPDENAAQMFTRGQGRRITHISRLTWRRVDGIIRQGAPGVRPRKPRLEPVTSGIAISADEVVLTASARPKHDPVLLLRAAAVAAERGLVLAPPTVARLVRDCPPLPTPWPDEARQSLVRLLASGRPLLDIWETLDETGAVDVFLPEWQRVRLLPHASVVHRFTVDRHQVETCIEASALIRRVARPDVLMVAALLHDIGKGGVVEHSAAGEPIARKVAERMGFASDEVDLIADLVRWHLLLPEVATSRDPEDPSTVQLVTEHVENREELELLAALTEADAKATGSKAWTRWRASMITTLVRRTAAALSDVELVEPAPPIVDVPRQLRKNPRAVVVEVFEEGESARVRVVSGDRLGLLADAAAMLALQKLSVRGARAWTQGGKNPVGVSEWLVDEHGLDAAVLRQRLEAIAEGRLEPGERLRRPAPARRAPIVVQHLEASLTASVIEVRADDRPGLIYTVCRALAELGISVRSAHVATLGPQAVDVFYVQESGLEVDQPLTPGRAALAVTGVLDALIATVAS
ncbi:MAG: ACT domain-containing protein, partial [Marmoricola sp.]